MRSTRHSIIYFFLFYPSTFSIINVFFLWLFDFFDKGLKNVIEFDSKKLLANEKEFIKLKKVVSIAEKTFFDRGLKSPNFFGFYHSNKPDTKITFYFRGISLVFSSSFLKIFGKKDIKSILIHQACHLINKDLKNFLIMRWFVDVSFWAFVFSFKKKRILFSDRENLFSGEFFLTIFYFYVIVVLTSFKYFREREYLADLTAIKFIGKKKVISPMKKILNLKNKEEEKFLIKYNFKSDIYKRSYIYRYFLKFFILKIFVVKIFSFSPTLEERISVVKKFTKNKKCYT